VRGRRRRCVEVFDQQPGLRFHGAAIVCRYEKHLIHWKVLEDGAVGIVTVLHERMQQIERFSDDFGG